MSLRALVADGGGDLLCTMICRLTVQGLKLSGLSCTSERTDRGGGTCSADVNTAIFRKS